MNLDRWAKPVLSGHLVTLRPYSPGDTDAAWEMVNDSEGSDLTHTTATFTYEQIREWCSSRNAQADRLDLAVIENATGLFAGEVVLNDFDPEQESTNFRIALRGPAWFGRGLGTEATRLIVTHGLTTIGLAHITLDVLARNLRAIRAYEKVGFRQTGTSVEDEELWIRMAIAAAEWASQ